MLHVIDKKVANHSYYVTEGWGLTIKSITYKMKGYIVSWVLTNGELYYEGNSQKDLEDTLKHVKELYELKTKSDHNKEILVIYTDNVMKAKGFLQQITTAKFSDFYFEVLDNIEIRECWLEDIEDAVEIATWASDIIENVFIPDKYFYLGPAQISRKRTRHIKALRAFYEKIAPDGYNEWCWLRIAFFGGLYYCPYPGGYWERPILGLDLLSAFIFCLISKKHCMSEEFDLDEEDWEKYLYSEDICTIGRYKITYHTEHNAIDVFKDEDGHSLKKTTTEGEYETVYVRFTNIDIRSIRNLCDSINITCLELYGYNLDYLPKEYIDEVLRAFRDKKNCDKKFKNVYDGFKKILNSFYGNSVFNYNKATGEGAYDKNRAYWKKESEKEVVPPQWGIFATAYCREIVLALGQVVEGWLYSGVDSIYCYDTEDNRNKIEVINDYIRDENKSMCEYHGYDYNEIKDLGTFETENHISKLKTWAKNQYAYESEEKGIVLKSSGCNKDEIVVDKNIFKLDKVPGGKRIIGDISDEYTKVEINGEVLESHGYYFEKAVNMDEPIEKLSLFLHLIRNRG